MYPESSLVAFSTNEPLVPELWSSTVVWMYRPDGADERVSKLRVLGSKRLMLRRAAQSGTLKGDHRRKLWSHLADAR